MMQQIFIFIPLAVISVSGLSVLPKPVVPVGISVLPEPVGMSVLPEPVGERRVLLCHVEGPQVYKEGQERLVASQVASHPCTHVLLGYAHLTNHRRALDINYQYFDPLDALLKERDSGRDVKVLVSIGGPDVEASVFSSIAAQVTLRHQFAGLVSSFIRKYRLDGVSLDWRYPGSLDRANFVELIKAVRTSVGGNLLAVESPWTRELWTPGFDLEAISRQVDLLVMSTLPIETYNRIPTLSFTFEKVEKALKEYLQSGLDKGKLLLGLRAWGLAYQLEPLESAEADIFKVPVTPGSRPVIIHYPESCRLKKLNQIWRDFYVGTPVEVPVLFRDGTLVSYENERSMRKKLRLIISKELLGGALYGLDSDDTVGSCSESTKFPLANQAASMLLSSTRPIFPPLPTPPPPPPTTTESEFTVDVETHNFFTSHNRTHQGSYYVIPTN